MTPDLLHGLIEAARAVASSGTLEPWLDKKDLAEHYACSVRSVETALSEGLPHAIIFGRLKFQVSQTDPWLRERGYWRDAPDEIILGTNSNGAGTADTAPRPTTRG
jgi:hypothetical protein